MQTDNPSKRRLNPFSFPSETNVRFALQILAVCMFAVSMSQPLSIITRLVFSLSQSVPLDEALEPSELDSPDEGDEEYSFKAEALSGVSEQLGLLAIPAGSIVILFVLATVIYRSHPDRIRRRKKLTPLAHGQYPTIHHRVNDAANLIGISPPPTVMLGEGLRSQNGQAFGTGKNRILGLGGGVRLLLVKAPARFRALLLHELAHIANRDIGPTYFSEALWRATIYVVVGPFIVIILGLSLFSAIGLLLSGNIFGLLLLVVANVVGTPVIFFVLGTPLAVILLTRAGLLRVREFYADWRASQWGAEKPLLEILRASAAKEKNKRGLRFHPTAGARLRVLKDPTGLFRLTMDLPFVVGILLGFVVTGLYAYLVKISGILLSVLMASVADLVETALTSSNIFLVQLANLAWSAVGMVNNAFFLILVLGLSYLVAGTVGLQIQREGVATMVTSDKNYAWAVRLVGAAVLMTVGLEIGFLIVPPYTYSPLGAIIGGLVDPLLLLLVFPWLIVFFLFTLLGLLYARFSARTVLGLHVGMSPPKWKGRLLTLVQSFALSALYFPLLVARVLILYPSDQIYTSTFLKSLIVGPLLYAGIFGATWMLMQVWRLVNPARCPSCRKVARPRYVIGQVCKHCGHELASWLFTASSPLTQTSEREPKGRLAKAQV